MADTGADNWEQRTYLPIYDQVSWYADGSPHTLPDDFYSSKYFIDKTIEFVASNEDSDQPFFAYIPFQAVHIPVQAPKEYSDKYAGVYDEGWSVMREKRRQTAVALGVIPKESEIKVTPGTIDWSSMTDEQRRYDARRMEVYAGMVDAMDFHIGRLMDYLKSIDEYENTVFIFTSDNGAASSPLLDSDGNSVLKNWFDRVGYNTDYESLGEKGSWVAIGPGNASIANSPLLYYKFHANEGGLRVPLIISGPGINRHGEITDEFTFESFDSVIYGKPTDGNSGYTVTTADGQGNLAMYVIRDEIQDFSKLPYYGKTGVKVKVTGEEGDILTGTIQRVESRWITVDIGNTEAIMPPSEQSSFERYSFLH